MRAANVIVSETLAELQRRVRPAVTTPELDAVAEAMTRQRGAVPAFKGYEVAGRVFPCSLCISVNDEVVHGIPSEGRVLHEGDIVGLVFGVQYQGSFGDSDVMVRVGQADQETDLLIRTTREPRW